MINKPKKGKKYNFKLRESSWQRDGEVVAVLKADKIYDSKTIVKYYGLIPNSSFIKQPCKENRYVLKTISYFIMPEPVFRGDSRYIVKEVV